MRKVLEYIVISTKNSEINQTLPYFEFSDIVPHNRLKTVGDVSERVHRKEMFISPAEVHLKNNFDIGRSKPKV